MSMPTPILSTNEQLEAIINKAIQCDAVGVDTEFVWERTYYPQLGLIQIALSDEECYAIDPVAISDLSALGRLLSDNGTVKILHDAGQDLMILQRATGVIAKNIFDTRIAAGFAGSSSTTSLGNLTLEQLDTALDKSATRTNWLKRPLSDDQLRYSLDDVRYLRALRVILLSKIVGPTIKNWLKEELNHLDFAETYAMCAPEKRYKKIKGVHKLPSASLAIAQAIAQWREGEAKRVDKPRGHIIKDETILEIAAQKCCTPEDLQKTSLSPKAQGRYSKAICQINSETLAASPTSWPQPASRQQLSVDEKNKLSQLKKLIQLKCDILGIDPPLLGNSKELKALIQALHGRRQAPARQTSGWRKEFFKEFFQLHHQQF